MKTLLPILAVIALVAPAAAHAQAPGGLQPSWQACMDSHLEPQQMDCIDTEYGYQDIRLNRNYRAAMARLAPPQRAVLRASEREWLRTHDQGCTQGMPEMRASMTCMLFDITRRANWLETYRPR